MSKPATLTRYSIGYRHHGESFINEMIFHGKDEVDVVNQAIDTASTENKHIDLVEWVVKEEEIEDD